MSDTDFRKEAVGLVGEMEVVKRTIELGLPLGMKTGWLSFR